MTRTKHTTGRNGQVIVIAALALVVFCVVAALAIDVGHIFLTRAELQNASDAAAVAGALELIEQRNADQTEPTGHTWATREAVALVFANHRDATCTVSFGRYTDGVFTPFDASVLATAVQVQAYRNNAAPGGPLGLFFAPAAGVGSVDVSAAAVATFNGGIRGIFADLRPFAIYEGELDEWGRGDTINLPFPIPGQELPEGQVTPGNWGWLNLDAGELGAPELEAWIDNGYDGPIILDQTEDGRPCTHINGSCGVIASLMDNVEGIIGQTIFMCIFDEVTEEGANTDFRIVGFLGFTLTNVSITGNHGSLEGRFEVLSNVPYGLWDPDMDDNTCTVRLVQ